MQKISEKQENILITDNLLDEVSRVSEEDIDASVAEELAELEALLGKN